MEISGPMPAASPVAIATLGLCVGFMFDPPRDLCYSSPRVARQDQSETIRESRQHFPAPATERGRLMRRILIVGLALLLIGAAPQAGRTQDWPTRPIKLVVPFSPGGSADTLGRIFA